MEVKLSTSWRTIYLPNFRLHIHQQICQHIHQQMCQHIHHVNMFVNIFINIFVKILVHQFAEETQT